MLQASLTDEYMLMRLHSWDQPTLVVKRRSKNPFGLINKVNKVVIELLLNEAAGRTKDRIPPYGRIRV